MNSPDNIKYWLIRVSVNECKNYRRSLFRKRTVNIEEAADVSYEPELRELLDALKNLPAPYREVIYLYYYEEYSAKEISEILKRKYGTVKSQLSRGRVLLKDVLKGEYYETAFEQGAHSGQLEAGAVR